MKHLKKLLALLIVLTLLASVGLAETVTATEETSTAAETSARVVATVNGTPIYETELQEAHTYYTEQGYSVTYAQILEILIETHALRQIITEKGFDQFTDEDQAKFAAEAQEAWNSAIENYVTSYLSEDTEEARTALQGQADQYFRAMGYSPEYLAENMASQEAQNRYIGSLVSADSITREDVQAYLDTVVESQKAEVGESANMYELYQMYMGREYLFTPAGYRRVLHILMKLDENVMTAYTEASEILTGMKTPATAEEAAEGTADAATAEAEAEAKAEVDPFEDLKAALDAMVANGSEAMKAEYTKACALLDTLKAEPEESEAKEALYADLEQAITAIAITSLQPTIDEIENRLQNGEEFAAVAKDYNEDPGEDFNEGYKVHPESIMWDPVFRDAAFSAEMTKPGDHSKPVLGSYGVHILYYLADVPEGAVELTDDLYVELAETLLQEKQYDVAETEIREKIEASEITRATEIISELDDNTDEVEIDFDDNNVEP